MQRHKWSPSSPPEFLPGPAKASLNLALSKLRGRMGNQTVRYFASIADLPGAWFSTFHKVADDGTRIHGSCTGPCISTTSRGNDRLGCRCKYRWLQGGTSRWCRHFVPRTICQYATRGFFALAYSCGVMFSPLLEEKRHAGSLALFLDMECPLLLHGTRPIPALASHYHPVNSCQVQVQVTQQGFRRTKT